MDEKNKIQRLQNAAPILPNAKWDLVSFNNAEEELGEKLNIYRIQQKNDKNLAAGMINTLTEQKEEVNFTWLALTKSRIWFPTYNPKNPNQEPFCKSINGVVPNSGTQRQNNPCKGCAKAKWIDRTTPPVCTIFFNMMCWDLDEKVPFVLPIKKEGIAELKKLKTTLKYGLTKYAYDGLSPQYCVKVKWTLREVERPGYVTYYLPNFEIVEKISKEEASSLYIVTQSNKENLLKLDIYKEEVPENQENPKTQTQLHTLPNFHVGGWELEPVPWKEAGGLTWKDLSENKQLSNGQFGQDFLKELLSNPQKEIQELAKAALHKINFDKFEIPF